MAAKEPLDAGKDFRARFTSGVADLLILSKFNALQV